MTHEQALKTAGEIIAATIMHMASVEGITVAKVIKMLAQGHKGATARFNAHMDAAAKYVRNEEIIGDLNRLNH